MADSIFKGVATVDPTIVGGVIDNSPIGGTTPAAGAFTTLSASGAATFNGNVLIGDAAADTVGFYGATKVSRRAAACQATSTVGTASSTDVTSDLKATVIELMNTMNALGIWKGSA